VRPLRTSPAGRTRYVPRRALVVCEGAAWKNLFVQVFTHDSVQQPFLVPAVAEPHLTWVTSGAATIEERDPGGEWKATRVIAEDFYLTHSLSPYELRWVADQTPFQAMHLYLSIPLFERVAREVTGRSDITLANVSGGKDGTLSGVLRLLGQELLTRAPGGGLVVEGLAQSLAVHLVRNHATQARPGSNLGGLPGAKMRRAIAFMSEHLDAPFTLRGVAGAAGLSAFHFSRMFKRATGIAPSRYFMRLRIAEAQRLLQETDASILEISAAVGYRSPSHFATVFRGETGKAPSDSRRR
jgi:AraC family transcriptional regulator